MSALWLLMLRVIIAVEFLLGFFRLALMLYFNHRLAQVSWVQLLFNGAHTDLVVACFLAIPLAVALLLSPLKWKNQYVYVGLYLAAVFSILIILETATFNFISQYDVRPNRIFYEYLIYPKEVLVTLWKGAPLALVIIFLEATLLPFFIYKSICKKLSQLNDCGYLTKTLSFLPMLILLSVGARGSLHKRPFNTSSVSFSSNRLANELVLNSMYSVMYSLYREKQELSPTNYYGKIDTHLGISLMQNRIGDPSIFTDKKYPFARLQKSNSIPKRPPNVVFFLQESLGAEYVGHLGGPPITPNLDQLAKQGLFFRKMYSTGTRTVRGIEGVVASFLPTPGPSIVKLEKSKTDFFTAAQLFKNEGYITEFIYGGDSNFDEMKSFFIGNGVDHFYDYPTFRDPTFENEWGVSDEDLVRKSNEVFKSHGDKPFFAVMLSTSSHHPYEFPDGRIQLFEQPKNTFNNAVKYADFAIGELINLAKKEEYYKNTIFVITADHSTRVFGDDFVPIQKFHIPAVIIGPGVPVQEYSKPTSQIDILPTVLGLSGLEVQQSSLGRDALAIPVKDPGRAIMQYHDNFAYLLGDEIIILRPNHQPAYFNLQNDRLIPSKNKFLFLDEAVAVATVPWYLYQNRLHGLSPKNE